MGKKKETQKTLPGVMPEYAKEIEALAGELKDYEQDRLAIQKKETELREKLAKVMMKHGIDKYPLWDTHYAVTENTVKAYVRKKGREKKSKKK